jgi:hypothetical protein
MKTPILAFAVLALILGAAAPLVAQSLLDNQYYHKAQELLAQSQQAYDKGDYDTSTTLANQAKEQFAQSESYIAELTQFYRANGYLSVAKDRVSYAKSVDADVHYKDAYSKAVTDVGQAKTALDGKEYPKSIDLSKEAIALLKDVAPVTKTVVQAQEPGPVELPQYYVVRLRLPLRDCFWRIAAYPFVYNDPWKWRLLYDANKDALGNPKNPNLIEVGMRVVIPALADEKRTGDYDPSVEYPPLPAK